MGVLGSQRALEPSRLGCYHAMWMGVSGRLNRRKTGPQFVHICYLSGRRSDMTTQQSSNIQMDARTSLDARIPFLWRMLSSQSR